MQARPIPIPHKFIWPDVQIKAGVYKKKKMSMTMHACKPALGTEAVDPRAC